ncbi:hypothetical protein [uncultured Aquimarina sp.]|uniref:hypothetical protein n=1 Tax=uncultured Aquimarina sp. TaxID=575652 RepID=UPI00262D2BEF|nr:hypothetical protein [uncultured Aquimarina sp.]
MKQIIGILTLLIFSFSLSAQNVKINSKLKVDSTILKIKQLNSNYNVYSTFDNKNTDSLIVTIGTIGTSVTAIKIDLTEKPKAYIILWSDYAEYNGKDTLRVELEYFDLELNASKFDKDARIMGRISGKTNLISNSSEDYQIEFNGEFNHIIGKLMMKKKVNDKYIIIDNH